LGRNAKPQLGTSRRKQQTFHFFASLNQSLTPPDFLE
jgi:hypothetical protein